jgi:hypothetical protein
MKQVPKVMRGIHFENLEPRLLFAYSLRYFASVSDVFASNESATLGRDGSLYANRLPENVGELPRIERVLSNGKMVKYQVPAGFGTPETLVTAKDGSIWFNTSNADSPVLGHLLANGRFRSVAINHEALTIGAASDGSIWFSSLADGLGRVSSKGSVTYLGSDASNIVTKLISSPNGGVFYDSVAKSSDPSTTPYVFSVHSASVVRGQLQDRVLYSGNTTFNFDNGPQLDVASNLTSGSGQLWFFDGYSIKGIDPTSGAIASDLQPDVDYTSVTHLSGLISRPDGDLWYVDHSPGGHVYDVFGTYDISLTHFLIPHPTPVALVNGTGNTLWMTGEEGAIHQALFYAPSDDGTEILSGEGFQIKNGVAVGLQFNNLGAQDDFEIERATSLNGKYIPIGMVSGVGPLYFPDAGFDPNVNYHWYRVRSRSTNAIVASPINVPLFYQPGGG